MPKGVPAQNMNHVERVNLPRAGGPDDSHGLFSGLVFDSDRDGLVALWLGILGIAHSDKYYLFQVNSLDNAAGGPLLY